MASSAISRLALALLCDFQASLDCNLSKPLPNIHGSEQRDAPTSEPSLGEPRKLLERVIAGIPE
jgi:hypothetical protein